ncbi:MAG: hypothetical protein JRD87_00015 [Deltaproteobacteria bacterium]|jgi:hypothetical protein|nr:hypothetical protein [Deltaproteobacteria bacterium]MBW2710767.1 hypothetical protein [Deltaproteobacteria bacterium]
MPKEKSRKSFPFNRLGNYRIRVLGSLDESWSEKLGGLRITTSSLKDQGPVTELVGPLRDQAELSGLLNMLYEHHLTLLSVEMLKGVK